MSNLLTATRDASETNYNLMQNLAQTVKLASFGIFLLAFALPQHAAAQACTSCDAMNVKDTPVMADVRSNGNAGFTSAATSPMGKFIVTISADPSAPLPASLRAGRYPGWCATQPLDGFQSTGYTVTSTPVTTPALTPLALSGINYILNHKEGMITDVQEAIWATLGTRSEGYLIANHLDASEAMYLAAKAAASATPMYAPLPGQKVALALVVPPNTTGQQNIILEIVNCGALGDLVWLDKNNNGLQDAGEPGLNGVTVTLTAGSTVMTTVTSPSPADYPFMTPGTDGYYQFKGLCPGGTYTVTVDGTQNAVRTLTLTVANPPADSTMDSNPNPTTTTLASKDPNTGLTLSPSTDETIDFGFYGSAPITAVCPDPTAYYKWPYQSKLAVTGGTIDATGGPSYSIATVGGGLPTGLTLNSSTGAIGTLATAIGAFPVTFRVTDAKTGAVMSPDLACTITVNRILTAACVADPAHSDGTLKRGDTYSGTTRINGAPPFSFFTSGNVPADLTWSFTPQADGSTIAKLSGVVGQSATIGDYVYGLTVKDSTTPYAQSSINSCGLRVVSVTPIITCPSTQPILNTPYTSVPLITGGVAPYNVLVVATYTATGHTAFTAADINPATGVLTFTPTEQGAISYTLTVTYGSNQTVTQTCGFIVAQPFSPSCPATTAMAGSAYDSFVNVINGSGSFTYAVAPGSSLPAGLALGATAAQPNNRPSEIAGIVADTGLSALTTYTFAINVTDTGVTPNVTIPTGACSVNVLPRLSSTCSSATVGVVGLPFSSTMTPSGGSGSSYQYLNAVNLPAGLTLGADGSITGSPKAAGTFTYSFDVKDAAGNLAHLSCTITIYTAPSANCLSVTAVQGNKMSSGAMVGSGGSGGPYTFSATGLPSGLSMAGDGTISGTPTVSGTVTYHITITDKDGHTGTFDCSIVVLPPPTATCAVVTVPLVQGYDMTPVSVTAPSDGTGAPYTFSATSLPTGIIMDASGKISGRPTQAGTFNYTVTITDRDGNVGTVNCTIAVNPPPAVACVGPYTVVQGFQMKALQLLGSAGSGGPYTFSSSNLPVGLTIVASGPLAGTISGTPTAAPGEYPFSVTVSDAQGNSTTVNCGVITIKAPPVVTCLNVSMVAGNAITTAMNVSPGSIGYTFSAANLPAGLTMSADGTISGTPTVSGTFSYTVTIADNSGNVGTANCSVTVAPPPAITANCVTINATLGAAITPVTMTASGGAGGSYTFTASGLPTGLSMSASGTISGTPTVSGTFSYTVTIADKSGKTGTVNCSVTVNAPIGVTCAAISAITGVALAPVTLTATGGSPVYKFTATGLPAGVTISTGGTISGTPTVSGSFSYTVTVTDSKGNTATSTCSMTVGVSSNMCGLTWGYWKNHVSLWPVTSMWLGNQSYDQTELQNVLNTPVAGDASIELAHQLIAAKFNVLHGTNPATDSGAIAAADNSLGNYAGKLPYNVASASTAGSQMTAIAAQLDYFNQDGKAQAGCGSGPSTLVVVCAASTGTVGAAYNSAIVASGGMGGPYTYTLASGTLPPGLTLNADGTITGVPNDDGSYSFSVLVADSSNNSGSTVGTTTTNCTIVIAPKILCPTATGKVNETYASPIVVSGATTPYTLSIVSGSLPPGLSLDLTTNSLKGTPTTAGTYSFTIKATDQVTGISTTSNCTITIASPTLALICPAGTAQTTITYSSSVNTTGGSSPYSFSLVSGTLPPGLIPNGTTGQLIGVPTATGTFTFTVGVSDSARNSTSTSCSIVVTTPTGNITAGMFTTYTQGGWGASPKGNNPGMLLSKNFTSVYSAPGVVIGGSYKLTFGAASNVDAFLPQGSTAGVLKASATNPATSTGGVLAGQTLALQLSVDFSNKGVTPKGLGSLHVVSGKMAGFTVQQVLDAANQALGGGALPAGMTINDVVSVLDSINQNFDNGTSNKGYLRY